MSGNDKPEPSEQINTDAADREIAEEMAKEAAKELEGVPEEFRDDGGSDDEASDVSDALAQLREEVNSREPARR